MRFTKLTLILVIVLTAPCVVSIALERAVVAADVVDESQAMADVKRLGGSVEREDSPGQLVVAVEALERPSRR